MMNFFKMKYYEIEKKGVGDGFTDLKKSSQEIKENFLKFSTIVFIFITVSILKDIIFANTASGVIDYQEQNSLMLQGSPNFGFVGYILSFFIAFLVYFFVIDAFTQLKSKINFKESIKFSFVKLLDYRVYLLSFSVLLFVLFSLRIMVIPIANALPDLTIVQFTEFVSGYSAAIESQNLEIFLNSNDFNRNIVEAINGISPLSLGISFGCGALFLVAFIVFHFTMFINIVLFHGMTFFEALKASVYLNIRNGLYLMIATLGVVGLGLISTFFISPYVINIPHLGIVVSSIVEAYALFIFVWIISLNTKEIK